MYINFINNKTRAVCEDIKTAQRKLGHDCARRLFQRLTEMRACENLKILHALPGPRCHPLIDNRQGQYAVDLTHPRRLIFLPKFEGEFDEKLVTDVEIIDITDYH